MRHKLYHEQFLLGAGHLGTTVSVLTLWALGRLGTEDVWAPPFRRRSFGAVWRHCR